MPGIIVTPETPTWVEEIPLLLRTDRALGSETQGSQNGDLNLQAIALDKRTAYLKEHLDALELLLGGLDTETLGDLDLVLLALENTTQIISIAAEDTTKNINLANGAIVQLNCGNTNACTLTFSNPKQGLSGLLTMTAVSGQDRQITVPATWGIAELSRTLLIRTTKTNTLPFEYVRLAATTPSVVTELVIAGSLSPNLLMPT